MTFGLLDRLEEVINGKPTNVFTLIGINDLARNVPDTVVGRNDRRIIEAIKGVRQKPGVSFTLFCLPTALPANCRLTTIKRSTSKTSMPD